MYAVMMGKIEVVKLLLANKANDKVINNKGKSIYNFAEKYKDETMINLFNSNK